MLIGNKGLLLLRILLANPYLFGGKPCFYFLSSCFFIEMLRADYLIIKIRDIYKHTSLKSVVSPMPAPPPPPPPCCGIGPQTVLPQTLLDAS